MTYGIIWLLPSGDSPKAFKLYIDGAIQNQPVIHSSGTISLHLEEPSLGALVGTTSFPGYGNYMGSLDELRIYDRGLDANEVQNIFDGDFLNDGFLDFLAIEKPQILTQTAIDVTPAQATMRVEVQSIGGDVQNINSTTDYSFKRSTFETLQGWYSGYNLADSFSNGEIIGNWEDISGGGRDFENVSGDPRVLLSGLKVNPLSILMETIYFGPPTILIIWRTRVIPS